MDFKFERAIVLGALIRNSDGSITICPEFRSCRTTIPTDGVHYEVTEHLQDSNVVVVDFGPEGLRTKEVVIGVAHEENLEHISRNKFHQPFAGLLE